MSNCPLSPKSLSSRIVLPRNRRMRQRLGGEGWGEGAAPILASTPSPYPLPQNDRGNRLGKGYVDRAIISVERGLYCLLAFLLLLPAVGCNEPAVVAGGSTNARVRTVSANQAVESTFDDIKFEMELDDQFKRSMLTEKVEDLFGQRIRIRGYMYPTLKRRGLTGFVLVRDNQECCFGPGAALFDCIRVQMHPDKTAEFSIRPIAVEGLFKFEEFTDMDGTTRAIYLLEQASVE
jgi:hypothetical protein